MARVQIGNVYPSDEYLMARCAPAGYGLGRTAAPTSNLDTALKCGWYSFGSDCYNRPVDFGVVLVLNRYDTEIVQIAFDVAMEEWKENGAIARRVYHEGAWDVWEYINPPMMPGVEYRTTERWQGKPVYTKLINFGASADGASIAHELNPSTIVRYSAVAGSIPLPHFNTVEPEYQITVSVGATNITMACGESRTGLQTYVQVWYAK